MTVRYKVRLKGTDGLLDAEFDHWRSLSFSHLVDDIGMATFKLHFGDDRVSLFGTDTIMEVWRTVPDKGLDWYREWVGLRRKQNADTSREGDEEYTAEFLSLLDLIERRYIQWPKGQAESEKADVGETVMKEFVDENAGPGATTGAGRLVGGVTSGLSVEVDGGGGDAWAGERSFKPLLKTLQEIALATSLRFDVIDTGVAGGIQTFEFRTYEDYRGQDRSTNGLVAATGLNGAGNIPVVFSLERGNMASLNYSADRKSEITSVLVLGEGAGATRLTQEVVDAGAEAVSPWNHRESIKNANQETTSAALTDIGNAELERKQARTSFRFDFQQTEDSVYGQDFHWGDLVTCRIFGADANLEIVGANISVLQGNEDIKLKIDVSP